MSTGRILIVDDSENIRNVLQMNFEWLGYEVICASDGEEALNRINEDRPDLIVLDVMMPRLNGYQVCRSIKSDPSMSGIPIVFLSAKDQQGDKFWGKDCGADEYLTKPFSAAKLERVVEQLLKGITEKSEAGVITTKMRALQADGFPCCEAIFTLDAQALQVYRQKYGEMRFQEALDGTGSTLDVVLRGADADCAIEMSSQGSYRAVLACDETDSKAVANRICLQADLMLRSMYDREDAERGYVITRGPAGEDIHVPLMTLQVAFPAGKATA